jgi:hypothetical protein
MQSDGATRILLAVIAIAVLLLVGQAFGLAGGASGASRYEVLVTRGRIGTVLVRWDRATGQVWQRRLASEGPWREVTNDAQPGFPEEEAVAVPEPAAPPQPASEPGEAPDAP